MALILENQIIFVQGYENKLTMFYFIGGGLNLVLNSILAVVGITKPEWYILTTIVAELLVIALDILLINNNKLIDLRKLFIHAGKYVLYSSGFFIIYGLISWIRPIEMVVNGALLINIFVTIVSCVIYYVVVLALVKDEIFYEVIHAVKNKVLKKG